MQDTTTNLFRQKTEHAPMINFAQSFITEVQIKTRRTVEGVESTPPWTETSIKLKLDRVNARVQPNFFF